MLLAGGEPRLIRQEGSDHMLQHIAQLPRRLLESLAHQYAGSSLTLISISSS